MMVSSLWEMTARFPLGSLSYRRAERAIHRIRVKAQANSIKIAFIGGIFQDRGAPWLHAHLILQAPLTIPQQMTLHRLYDEVSGYSKDGKGLHLEPIRDLPAYLSYVFEKHIREAQGWKMTHYRMDFLNDDVKRAFMGLQSTHTKGA